MENDSDIVQYHWQVSFHFTPSLRESEIINIYDPIECENRAIEFKVIDEENEKRTQVTVDYKTNKIDEVLPDSKAKYEYAEETKARKYALFFQNLILERALSRNRVIFSFREQNAVLLYLHISKVFARIG